MSQTKFQSGKNSKEIEKMTLFSVFYKKIKYPLMVLIFFFVSYVIWVGKDLPDPNRLNERVSEQSTKIYDRTEQHLLYEIYTDKKRTIVELEKIPKYLIDGVIATEDKTFYEHHGIRPLSLIRSFVYGLVGKGRIGGGASTLTQQLVKNAILTNERTLTRKIKEVILALWLEQKYTKAEILKIYFNEIPYGSTNYGVESAAQSYFGKHVADLTLAEAATLAGLPQKPSVYLNNVDALKNRRNFVLQRMVYENYLSLNEAEKAKNEPLTIKKQSVKMDAPHFVKYVQQQLTDEYGENIVGRGGLKVVTTLDWEKQKNAERAIQEKGKQLLEQGGANNAALLALDPKNSQILAMVGSRDFYDDSIDGQFNVTVQARRQPGSSIKPIIYAAAFAKGYTPGTVLFDVVTLFGSSANPYIPQNYDFTEHGLVTMRQALQGSLNIPAVKTLYLVGLKKAISFAEKMGYSTFGEGNFGLSLVLGGGEVKMLEHVNAYAIFANNGRKNTPVSILDVEDSKGKNLYKWKQPEQNQIIDPGLAATMSNVLSDDAARVFVFGSGSTLSLGARPVAAKSGTTNNYIDAWVVGYTPSLVAGVWAGNSDNSPMKQGFGCSRIAGQIWNYFMRESLKNTLVEKFPTPPVNKTGKAVLNGSVNGGIKLLVDKYTNKLATSSTPENFIVERTYLIPHDILHYVDKDNPAGPAPENPETDPLYFSWESAIQDWMRRKKIKEPTWEVSFEDPPTEYDDVHSLESLPTLEILSPAKDEKLNSRLINITVNATAPRGVSKVTYRIDGKFVGISQFAPFSFFYNAKTLIPGTHTLQVTAEDDVGNRVQQEGFFVLDVPAEPAGVFFDRLPTSATMADFPLTIFLQPHEIGDIKEVNVVGVSPNNEKILLFKTNGVMDLFDNSFVFVWKIPPKEAGIWKLNAEVELKNGASRISDSSNLEIKI